MYTKYLCKTTISKSCTDNQTPLQLYSVKGGGNLILPKNISLLKSTNKKYL